MISRLRARVASSCDPNGYLRWPLKHIERIGTPVSNISFTNCWRSSFVHSRRLNFSSVSSILISKKSNPVALTVSNFSLKLSVFGIDFSYKPSS